jgi:hypothetical protein
MAEAYKAVIVQDQLHGIGLRHFFVEPPIESEELRSAIVDATGMRHIKDEEGWTKFVIDSFDYTPSDVVFDKAQKAIGESEPGSTLDHVQELDSNPTWAEFRGFVTSRSMKYD